VSAMIAAENRRVRDQAALTDPNARTPYVSVALLMPMTAPAGSPLSAQQIRVSLEGAYSAQIRANQSHDIEDPTPLIQLLLANEGSHQNQWATTLDTLLSMSDPAHPLLAVIGLGVSLPSTQEAATRLDAHGLPMVGAVLAANNLGARRLFEVGASTLDYATALHAYSEQLGVLNNDRALVYDDSDDNFTHTLKLAFDQQVASHIAQRESFRGQANPAGATADLFAPIVQNICLTGADQVLFAGRFRDLAEFANALAIRTCVNRAEISVYTASTGLSSLFTADFERTLRQGRIRLHYASNTDAPAWSAGVGGRAPGYTAFHRAFVDQLRFSETDLANGYSIMHHDAMMSAVWAIRLAPKARNGVPVREDVYQMLKALHGVNAVPAASGTLSFGDGSGWPSGKLVPVQQYPPDGTDIDRTPIYSTDDKSI
jgi:ABC-type branched-subunit amino acid transport system substrate-binding protein